MSLTLPHAGSTDAKGETTAEGHVDIVRAGIAQSSMAVARSHPSSPKKGRTPLVRALSLSLLRSFGTKSKR
ncbi:hypothetical protein A0H81_01088 [Grifola frondosa]|uniref:Uncharacterized protein n=1 Tax=Grifola frondosa TaxID=5627 RepID=A0A1C7MSS9_GRIFR|nr:hypothetical protein A0H81_01088 [Grifola frondosa]